MPPINKTMKHEREEERYNVYLQHIRRGKFQTEAARSAGLSAAKVRLRRQTDPQFRQDELDALQEFSESVERVLVDAAFGEIHYVTDPETGDRVKAQRDIGAALSWLKARNHSVFNPTRQVDVNVHHTASLDFGEFHALKAQLEARRPAELAPGQDDIVDAEVIENPS